MKHFQWTLLYAIMAIFMVACGGGGGSAPPGSLVPSVPDNIQTISESNQITLSWNNVSGATSYNVYWDTTDSVTTANTQIADVTSPYDHTSLTSSTTYYYIVTAVNVIGESSPSSVVSAKTQLPPKSVPSAPQYVHAKPGDKQVILSWNTVNGATSYNIYWDTISGVTTSDNSITDATSQYTHTSLTNGTKYYYIVTAVNSVGESIPSNEISTIPDVYKVYFVSSAAPNDNGDGTSPASAKKTIPAAIDAATAPAEVRVNAGIYDVSSGLSTHVVLTEGISLYGGYNANFSNRNPAVNITMITDKSTATGGPALPNSALEAGAGISAATIIDGFNLNGSSQIEANYTAAIRTHDGGSPTIQNNTLNGGSSSGNSYGIYNDASSPTVQNNIINGGSGSGSGYYGIYNINSDPIVRYNTINGGSGSYATYGIYSIKSTPIIRYNTINGGSGSGLTMAVRNEASSSIVQYNTLDGGSGSSDSRGMYNASSSPIVQNNTINGGSSGNASMGIYNAGGSPKIQNNTINGGSGGTKSYGIFNYVSSSAIDNNIIFTSSLGTTYCINNLSKPAVLGSVLNNDLFSCTIVFTYPGEGCPQDGDGDSNATTCTLTEMEATDYEASNNVSTDPAFVDAYGTDDDINTMDDNDWHFSTTSPTSVTTGGLNGIDNGWGYTIDKDGINRPGTGSNWSMGAYEPPP